MSAMGPKPLVRLNGESLLERMLRIITSRSDAESITIITNANIPEIAAHTRAIKCAPSPKIIEAVTAGSAESLAIAAESKRCIGLTVDTLFSPARFSEYVDEFERRQSDCLMAVTDYIDDEKPLYVKVNDDRIVSFDDTATSPLVSAGIYGLSKKAVDVLVKCRDKGIADLREFQRYLIKEGVDARAHNIGKAIDIDRPEDAEVALKFIINRPES